MSRRTLLCEKLTGDMTSLIWIDSHRPGYRYNTLDLHVLESVRSSLALLAAVITVTAKYYTSLDPLCVWWTTPAGQALVSCQHEAMATPTCAHAGS